MIDLSPETVVFLMFIGILGGLALGHPVAFIMGGLATIFAYLGWGPQGTYLFQGRAFDSTTNNILIAIPQFVLMASFLGKSGIGRALPFDDAPFRADQRRHRVGGDRHVRH